MFDVVDGQVRVFVAGRAGTKTSRRLTAGDFGFVPAGLVHAYQVEAASQVLGVASGGFERFFQQMGQPTDHGTVDQPPFVPGFPRMQAAAQAHDMEFLPDFDWSDAES